MAEGHHHNWLELCKAASETNNADEFLNIVRELNEILEREEQIREGKAVGESKSTQELPC
ncbi:MAG: hypothetical protein WCC32_10735 [Terriglobales bacterium]